MHTSTLRRSSRSVLYLLLLILTAGPAAARGGIEVEGPIQALGASSVTVQGMTFAVTAQTSIIDDDENPLTFADLAVGLAVEVEGHAVAGGSLVADEIKVEDRGGDEIEVEGLVSARTDSSLTVGGFTFGVTSQTVIMDDDDDPLPFSAITVGLAVEVEGSLQTNGALVAREIKVEDRGDGEVKVEGLIEVLSAEALTVSGVTFAITNQTVVVDNDDRPLSVDTLAVGLYVEVEGRTAADGTLAARTIEVEDFDDDELELRGAIEAIGDASLTVLGTAFTVTGQTAVLGDRNQPIAFADLVVGETVEVKARLGTDGTRIATRIKREDEGAGQQEIELRAALDATGDSLVVVLGRPFAVRTTTQIRGLNDETIALADLPAGLPVEVKARRDADGTLVALRIEREDGPAGAVRLRARVTAVVQDTVFVLSVPFAAAGAQVVRIDGSAGTFADLAAGQSVFVTGTQDATGATAAVIRIRRAAQAAGRVGQTTAGGFDLPGLAVATTAQTLFVTETGAPASASDVTAGRAVRAYGTLGEAGGLTASRVVLLGSQNVVAGDGAPQTAALAIERVFPNPTTAVATVRFSLTEAGEARVAVVDMLGRTVTDVRLSGRVGANDARLDVRALPAGTYGVRLSVDGRTVGTSRLTVVR